MPIALSMRVIALLLILTPTCFLIFAIIALGSFRIKDMRLRLNRSEYLSGRPGRSLDSLSLRNGL